MPNNRNCGFFNSNEEGDRPYDAEDISQMMTGMVTGGVFPNVGDKFAVTASGTEITIGTGKAWWHGKWFENATEFTIDDGASSENDRIDILVIEVNETEEVRNVDFKIIKGIPSSEPEEPEIVNAGGIYQLPIAKITRLEGDVEIATENLEYLPGTTRSPWVETALDPNKCVYAYIEEAEDVDLETITVGGTATISSASFVNEGTFYRKNASVTFSKPFKNVPVVVPSIVSPVYIPGNMQACIANVTKNGFYIQLCSSFNPSGIQANILVNWIATGLLND